MIRSIWVACLASVVVLLPRPATLVAADDRDPAHLFPPSTVLFAELRSPDSLLTLILNHPIRGHLESMKAIQGAYKQKRLLNLKAVVSMLESKHDTTWPELLVKAAGGGAAIGVDSNTNGTAIVIKGQDEVTASQLVATFAELARQGTADSGDANQVENNKYRGIQTYQIAEAKVATHGRWVVVTNNSEFGKLLLDNLLDNNQVTLASDKQFFDAKNTLSDKATAWGYANVATVRGLGVAKNLFHGQAGNPGAEILLGGILSNLQETPFVAAAITANRNALRLEISSPHDQTRLPESRHYFFGADGSGRAPPLLRANDTVFSAAAYRDVSQMWLRAGDLFNDRVNDQIAQADSSLTTLFSGKDFGEDILGAVNAEFQVVVTRQEYQEDCQPAIKLPGFALSFQLRDAETMRAEFRRTFQSLIGFLNVLGAMNGQPQLDLGMEQDGDSQLISASYVSEPDADLERLPINYNFSPAIAFAGNRFIVSSSQQLARELAHAQQDAHSGRSNTAAVLDAQVLREILADNRDHLVAQNMLQEGNTRSEAEDEIDSLLQLVSLVKTVSFQLTTVNETLRMQIELNLTNSTPADKEKPTR